MSGARIVTVGHGDRTLAGLVALLRDGGVRGVADVRRRPRSRRHPRFDAPMLAEALAGEGLAYRWFGAGLGGWRRARGEGDAALPLRWRGYAEHMRSAAFGVALEALLAWADEAGRVALLCAERDPRCCHRSLIADALFCRGVGVRHGVALGVWREHQPHPALRCTAAGPYYDRGVSRSLWDGGE